ncbi:CidA/LrgA family protein [Jeotgalibaca ciconiae]|uniref:CidA/LrgA family protein n=1 Tax=Jeotgalibaca ciconiae TaxID=2496265 RepID=A0A3S9HCG8_9LACT|nr:CidA/LrgA family protein [Jeotgalibaca ciconiae]AZP05044.1 CidA/LrgA family protein [Jeotgalibaca ciconiae]HJB24452.1 CidA/LrgA family protein [Candidatus Jeotgalibaca pullicola]
MKIIKQLFWIFLFSLLGEMVSGALANLVAIPGSVIGMVLLFFALHFKWLNLNQVEEVGTWLTDNMAIFFVPAGVGLMTNFDVLAEVWLQLLIIMIVTTAIMMWFIGSVVQKVKQSSDQKKDNTVVERTDTYV